MSVAGAVNPDTVNSEPATEMPEIVTGAVPLAVRTTGFVAYCPTTTLPKSMLVALTLKVGTVWENAAVERPQIISMKTAT